MKKEIITLFQAELDDKSSELKKINENNEVIIKSTNDNIVEFKKCVKNFGFTYKCFE